MDDERNIPMLDEIDELPLEQRAVAFAEIERAIRGRLDGQQS